MNNEIDTELLIKATAELEKEIQEELQQEDPEKAIAKKLVQENKTDENTK